MSQALRKSERRTVGRHPRQMKLPCSMKRIIQEGPWPATLANVTAEGLTIVIGQGVKPGMFLAVEVPAPGSRPKTWLVRVTAARPLTGRQACLADATFVKTFPAAELAHARQRIPLSGYRTTYRWIRVAEEGPWLVTMRNVSQRGIGLEADQPFAPGMYLKLEIPGNRPRNLRPRLIKVTHAKPHTEEQRWHVGGVFLRNLTEQELQILL